MYNLRYIEESAGGFDALHFFQQGFVNSAGSSTTVDLLITVLAVSVFMVVEARRIGMKYAWVYIVWSLMIAAASGVPLFLLMRERHLAAAREAA